ncbi:Oidioi.mRNA.OKI2018_I69.chr1.g2095.t1.cds [Oikopleura dioica]|uniref:Inositol-pentakisphosphate 2-kinase n=1 Tax=Oikopleura dioica TaxID=34765 RepID=A0ABN7STW4_OIKDI|nr:Oidioi.mRNA.OKI2018_I69.chr1.g2095.t1.cds [Oikopleura dioica]
MHWDPKDWAYRAEGGKHLVVFNQSLRKVLRFIKAPIGLERTLEEDKREIERRLRFEKLVVSPLLAEFGLQADSGSLVCLPADFCNRLSKRISNDRPPARKDKVIPPGARFAVLQDDFCQNIPFVSNIAIELKPKCSFVQPNRRSCQFCLMQLEKIRRGKYDSRSAYCPVDLFSSDLNRKRFAFAHLLENPQNNLRFFCDGELIYSMETLEHVGASCAKRFPQLIEKLCGFPDALDKVIFDLCNVLGASENDEHCFSSTFKNENFKNSESSLSCYQNGPLRALAALQRTSSHSANEVLESFKRLSPKQVEDLENPSHNWLASAKKQTDLSDVDIVRRHLISKTIKDCSLMIVFIPKKDGDIHFKMEIVDLDLKPTSKLFEHKTKEDALLKIRENPATTNL